MPDAKHVQKARTSLILRTYPPHANPAGGVNYPIVWGPNLHLAGWVRVDQDLAWFLSWIPWYAATTPCLGKQTRPPKAVYTEAGRKYRIALNRFVFFAKTQTVEEFQKLPVAQVLKAMQGIPYIGFKNGEVLDCRWENLIIRGAEYRLQSENASIMTVPEYKDTLKILPESAQILVEHLRAESEAMDDQFKKRNTSVEDILKIAYGPRSGEPERPSYPQDQTPPPTPTHIDVPLPLSPKPSRPTMPDPFAPPPEEKGGIESELAGGEIEISE